MSKKSWCLILALTLLVVSAAPALGVHEELSPGQFFTLVDENNRIVHQTAAQVYVGDEYITADNSRYKVQEISDNQARCVLVGREVMPQVAYDQERQAWIFDGEAVPAAAAAQQKRISIYHTHSDESYDRSDGTSSKEGSGGIYDVGDALASKLQSLGFQVEHNKNNHNPHDVNAYNRSRRTAATLLRNNPDAIFDVHRDAVPASQYQTEVKGQDVTKVKLVVGQSNPNETSSLDFAKKIKAVMDQKSPGLSNGIYIGRGDYNQDLSPRSMLIEVGSNTNTKDEAERGVQLFAESLPVVLGAQAADSNQGGSATPAQKPLTGTSKSTGKNIAILLVVLAAAGIGFYYLNKGKDKAKE
ncbi:MAG: stage II sporulation protein P [Syntrophomonas sp.]